MEQIMNYDANQVVNTNYDIQTLINLVGQNAATTNQMSQQLGIVVNSVNAMKSEINTIKDEMFQLKNNEEITTSQQENIIELAKRRVCCILGFDNNEIQKYMRTFIQRLYSDSRHSTGLGSKISRTKKCDYQRVIDYIEAWIPSCGCAELKIQADKRATARRKAKEQGYDC